MCFFLKLLTVSTTEIQFDRVELMNGSYLENFYNFSVLRINKFNRTTYVINAIVQFNNTADENFQIELLFHFNRLNNNQYSKMPLKIRKENICVLTDKYYRPFFMGQIKNCSNLPQFEPDEPACPIKNVFKE